MINLNYRDPRPIYEQIKENIRGLVVTGGLQAGEKLPSVRELSVQLAINPNTIQRAYRELESEGYIYSVPGKGSFVSSDDAAVSRRRDELLRKLDVLIAELRFLGATDSELIARITEGGAGA